MDRPEQERLFTCTAPLETAIEALELDRLRVVFRELFDEADRRLQRTGYDHDEVEVRRFLLCRRRGGETVRISTDSLADRTILIKRLQRQLGDGVGSESVSPADLTDVIVVRAEIDIVRDDWKWYGD
ncbi:MAG: hypothetical protein ACE5E5_12805 [Phycisphaerae bacterium]